MAEQGKSGSRDGGGTRKEQRMVHDKKAVVKVVSNQTSEKRYESQKNGLHIQIRGTGFGKQDCVRGGECTR